MAIYFWKKITENEGSNEENLFENIAKVKANLQRNYTNMQYVEDEKLLDYYTYKIKSDEAQYDFLVKEAKKQWGRR